MGMKIADFVSMYKNKLYPNMVVAEGFDSDPNVVEGQRLVRSLEAENQGEEADRNDKFKKLEPQIKGVLDKLRNRPKTCRIVKYSYGIFIRSGRAFRNQTILVTDFKTGEPMRFDTESSAKSFAEEVMHLTVVD